MGYWDINASKNNSQNLDIVKSNNKGFVKLFELDAEIGHWCKMQ